MSREFARTTRERILTLAVPSDRPRAMSQRIR
jgi:hypothetical protein